MQQKSPAARLIVRQTSMKARKKSTTSPEFSCKLPFLATPAFTCSYGIFSL
jgi:hypothetical protein